VKERIQHVWSEHIGPDGESHWPDDQSKRDKLASRLLGACVVGSIDYWLDLAFDALRNPDASPARRRERVDADKDDARRSLFASLTPEQRAGVELLLAETVRGVVFSILADLDQFPGARVDLVAYDSDTQEKLASVGEGDIFDLHDRLGGWIEEFSDYRRELEAG
jgi:hypothetical protein